MRPEGVAHGLRRDLRHRAPVVLKLPLSERARRRGYDSDLHASRRHPTLSEGRRPEHYQIDFRRARSRCESQKYGEKSGDHTRMECNRPVGNAHDIAPTPRHAGHARAGWLPETLDKQPDAALPIG
jgi:hypothetical protein